MFSLEVMGQSSAEMYIPHDNEVVISITVPKSPNANLRDNWVDILRLRFDDWQDGTPYGVWGTRNSITRFQAKNVAEFVNKHKNCNKLVIHCFAGISRSRSMAAAIAKYFQLPYDFEVFNSRVFDAVTRALEDYDVKNKIENMINS